MSHSTCHLIPSANIVFRCTTTVALMSVNPAPPKAKSAAGSLPHVTADVSRCSLTDPPPLHLEPLPRLPVRPRLNMHECSISRRLPRCEAPRSGCIPAGSSPWSSPATARSVNCLHSTGRAPRQTWIGARAKGNER